MLDARQAIANAVRRFGPAQDLSRPVSPAFPGRLERAAAPLTAASSVPDLLQLARPSDGEHRTDTEVRPSQGSVTSEQFAPSAPTFCRAK